MAFATKYRIAFYDVWKLYWEVLVQEDGFADTLMDLKGTGSPLTIEYLSDSDEFNEPIRPSKAVINIQCETDFLLTDLYSDQDFKYKVIVNQGATLKWQGFVTTSEYSEPYDCVPFPVTVTAIDGLNYLKDILCLGN